MFRLTRVPSSLLLSIDNVPPCSFMMVSTTLRPMPLPPARVVKNGRVTDSISAAGIPGPRSDTVMTPTPCFSCVATVTVVPEGDA